MTSMFSGILYRSSSTVINIGARIWVIDPAVNTVANTIPIPDYILNAARSINGVRYAVPLYSGRCPCKTPERCLSIGNCIRVGRYKSIRQAGTHRR